MSHYQLTWITPDLAVGYAPMSYAELDSIREQGIDAIVNLCGEYCDLHEIEEKAGFEIYYLPILDECAPDMEDMEKALAWLDEAIYLGKKVLVHCRFGIGRTGTFVTAYLLRRGLGMKVASRKLKHTSATPMSYAQWRLLKKYGKKSGVLKLREPSLESRNVLDLTPFFTDYEAVVHKVDEEIKEARKSLGDIPSCGLETDRCCFEYFDLELIEVIYLHNTVNRTLKSDLRTEIINKAVKVCKKTREIVRLLGEKAKDSKEGKRTLAEAYAREKILCPLSSGAKCRLYEHRPIRCRLYGIPANFIDTDLINNTLFEISRDVFFAFSGSLLEKGTLSFSLAETVSGKFVQEYFYYLASITTAENH